MLYLNDAIDACEQALKQQTDLAPACQTLGNVLQAMGKFEEAMHWHSRSVAPQTIAADYLQLGDLYALQEQWQQAIGAYQTALHLEPDRIAAYWQLADALSQTGRSAEALEFWYQALCLEPHQATASGHYSLGNLFSRQGDAERAIVCYTQAICQKPDHGMAHYQLAEVLRVQKRWQDAIDHYQQAIDHAPQPRSRYHLAELLLQQSQWDDAIAVLQAAIAAQPDAPWAYNQLGRALAEQERWDEAIVCHQRGGAARGWNSCLTQDYQFTRDWFMHNIPVWSEYLKPIAPNAAALEVGSFEGMASCWLLDQVLTHPSASLTCVDLWFPDRFDRNIAKTNAEAKVTKRVGDSHQVLPLLPVNSYDMVYIDGCPIASHIYKDAQLVWRLLKPNGLLIFDDYQWVDLQHPEQAPKLGIDAFLSEMQGEIEILHQAYQVIVKKS